jgi:hypothetical protein
VKALARILSPTDGILAKSYNGDIVEQPQTIGCDDDGEREPQASSSQEEQHE